MAKNKKPMTGASYNLTLAQKSWVEKEAEIRNISASDFIRELLDKEMKKALRLVDTGNGYEWRRE